MSVVYLDNEMEKVDDSFKVKITLGNDITKPETHLVETYQVESWDLADRGSDGSSAMFVGLLANDEGIIQIMASTVLKVLITPPKSFQKTADILETFPDDTVH